ncbi:MAG: hypothetical protein ACHQ15_01415 [Candidatus Limnocylindrales bacterium]
MNRLAAVIDEAAGAVGATRRARGEEADYEIDGVIVAGLGPSGAEFRVGPEVAAAALGTPDTFASGRGPGWVGFRPRTLDRFALDRIAAWLGLAARLSLPR